MRQRVRNEISTTFASHYFSRISLPEAITVEAAQQYGLRKTGQKTLLVMSDLAA
jgi:histidyl-tRNA synthetase